MSSLLIAEREKRASKIRVQKQDLKDTFPSRGVCSESEAMHVFRLLSHFSPKLKKIIKKERKEKLNTEGCDCQMCCQA